MTASLPPLNNTQSSSLALATAYFDALERLDTTALSKLFADEIVETIPFSATGEPNPWYVFTGQEQVMGYVK